MGVRIGGVWHEELPDPEKGGSDSGNGRNFDTMGDYENASGGSSGGGGGGGGSGGGGGGGGGGNSGGGGMDMAALREFFGQTSGFSREQLAEMKREFDEQMALKEREWLRQGLPELEIKQRLAQLEIDRFQSTTGLDYLKFASTLGGPADYFQASDFYRGAQQRGDVPLFLKALSSNSQMPAFAGAGAVPATPLTAAGIASRLTGNGATTLGGYNPEDALSTIGSIFKRGATGLAPNSLEQLSPSELGILQSGAKKLGYSWEDMIKSYGASRIGQMASTPV